MEMIEVSNDAISRATFLGRGIVKDIHLADLWQLKGGLIVELIPGTLILRRAAHGKWIRYGDHWVPHVNANEPDSDPPAIPARRD